MGCPAGPYSQKTVAYGTTADTRTCTECTCGGATCSGTLTVFDNVGCDTTSDAVALPLATCISLGQKYADFSASLAGSHSCLPITSAPMGSFAGSDPATMCCMP